MGHAATDHDALDVVGHDQRVDRPGETSSDVVRQGDRGVVAGRGALVDLFRARRAETAGDRRARRERFEAAVLPALAARATQLDDRVADLPGETARTAMQLPIEDDASGDPGPDGEVRDVVGAIDDVALIQADGGGTDVVLDDDRSSEGGL